MKAMEQINSGHREVDRFLHKYEARAGLSSRYLYYRRQPIQYRHWIDQGSPIPFDQTVEQEQMVEMYVPQHQFQRMVEQEERYQQIIEQNQRMFDALDRERADAQVRQRNEAVARAWRNYQTLLELARR